MPETPLIPLLIEVVHEEVPGFRTIRFAAGHGLRWKAGQFLTLVHSFGDVAIRRSYSITSSPLLGEPLAIGVRRIPNGTFSRYLCDSAAPGDVLHTTGAAGLFRLPEDTAAPYVFFFLAAGSGITPVWSLLRTALHGYPRARAVLVYSSHDPSVAIFRDGLRELQILFDDRFVLHELFSTDPDLRHARLNRDNLLELLRTDGGDLRDTLFYACGPEAYMRFCTYLLQESGVPAAHIRREDFVADRPSPARPAPPDTSAHRAHLYIYGKQYEVAVQYPETILRAALRAGIALPYSCETGRCASCAARCLQGSVWLAQNEVLTPEDLAAGLTLTCTGFPVNGDVHLSFE